MNKKQIIQEVNRFIAKNNQHKQSIIEEWENDE